MSRWCITAFTLVLTLIMLVIQNCALPTEGVIRVTNDSIYFLIRVVMKI